ncbi:hypothetical protein B0I35DRAFT_403551 [Stachybotrys elegans]|uniref:Uncharacterized protein n=1 Tax=Stachybotrys elegans TaxID=80388 RepID=A0A8K0T123_9HYPO|nr:hypothetical protein B0I35DRAFT_403551 [Stachybotrys elegans]
MFRVGECSFEAQARDMVDKGAVQLLFYGDWPGTDSIWLEPPRALQGHTMVTSELGESWAKALEQGAEVIIDMIDSWDAEIVIGCEENRVTPGALSSFTSWGPSHEMDSYPLRCRDFAACLDDA